MLIRTTITRWFEVKLKAVSATRTPQSWTNGLGLSAAVMSFVVAEFGRERFVSLTSSQVVERLHLSRQYNTTSLMYFSASPVSTFFALVFAGQAHGGPSHLNVSRPVFYSAVYSVVFLPSSFAQPLITQAYQPRYQHLFVPVWYRACVEVSALV